MKANASLDCLNDLPYGPVSETQYSFFWDLMDRFGPCVSPIFGKTSATSNVPTTAMLAAMMGAPDQVCFEFGNVKVLR